METRAVIRIRLRRCCRLRNDTQKAIGRAFPLSRGNRSATAIISYGLLRTKFEINFTRRIQGSRQRRYRSKNSGGFPRLWHCWLEVARYLGRSRLLWFLGHGREELLQFSGTRQTTSGFSNRSTARPYKSFPSLSRHLLRRTHQGRRQNPSFRYFDSLLAVGSDPLPEHPTVLSGRTSYAYRNGSLVRDSLLLKIGNDLELLGSALRQRRLSHQKLCLKGNVHTRTKTEYFSPVNSSFRYLPRSGLQRQTAIAALSQALPSEMVFLPFRCATVQWLSIPLP